MFFGRCATSVGTSTAIGAGYGVAWWVLGALILMPARLGVELLMFTMAWRSLVGHVIYGLLLGAAYGLVAPRLQRG